MRTERKLARQFLTARGTSRHGPSLRRSARPSTVRKALAANRPGAGSQDDDAILARIERRARRKRHLAEGHRHIDLADAVLRASPRIRAERLHAEAELGQRSRIPRRTRSTRSRPSRCPVQAPQVDHRQARSASNRRHRRRARDPRRERKATPSRARCPRSTARSRRARKRRCPERAQPQNADLRVLVDVEKISRLGRIPVHTGSSDESMLAAGCRR